MKLFRINKLIASIICLSFAYCVFSFTTALVIADTGIPIDKATTGELHIRKFNDLDGNGHWDPGEPAIPNWPISVTAPDGTVTNGQTDGSGQLTITGAPGTYNVSEGMLPGWTPTTPNPQTGNVTPGGHTDIIFGNKQNTPPPITQPIEPPHIESFFDVFTDLGSGHVKITSGKTFVIKGQLNGSDGKPIANKNVVIKIGIIKDVKIKEGLKLKSATKKKSKAKIKYKIVKKWFWKNIAATITDSNGNFIFKMKPKKTSFYKLAYDGDSTISASSSKIIKVTVKKAKKKAKKKKKAKL